jgi:archaemetzincin
VKIAMIAIGRVDAQVLADAQNCIRERFGCEVEHSAPIALPDDAFDARRRQHSSVAFMLALARQEVDAARVLGITECDLFIPMLTFVFGQAQLRGRVALVSLARLRQEFYGAAADDEVLRLRMAKEIGHELGHSFGLIHCPDRECVMSLATSIQDVDRKAAAFCHSCGRLVAQADPALQFKGEENESEMADSGRR